MITYLKHRIAYLTDIAKFILFGLPRAMIQYWLSNRKYKIEESSVSYTFTNIHGKTETVRAILLKPIGATNRKAVVLLQSGGGWVNQLTRTYARFLTINGIITLQPRLFMLPEEFLTGYPKRNEYRDLPKVFGALEYLASRDDVDKTRISVIGFSYGGFLTIAAATEWATSKYSKSDARFFSYAPFYPICWVLIEHINRRKIVYTDFPEDFLDKWVQSPMRIFQGTDDDYEDNDPLIFEKLRDTIPDPEQRKLISSSLYPVSHGWDRFVTRSFNDPLARKGQGGQNTNTYSAEITVKCFDDLLSFIIDPFRTTDTLEVTEEVVEVVPVVEEVVEVVPVVEEVVEVVPVVVPLTRLSSLAALRAENE